MIEVHGRGGYGMDETVEWEGPGWYRVVAVNLGRHVYKRVPWVLIGDDAAERYWNVAVPEELLSEPADDDHPDDYESGQNNTRGDVMDGK